MSIETNAFNEMNSGNDLHFNERKDEGERLRNALKEKQITEELARRNVPQEKQEMVRKALKDNELNIEDLF